MRTNWTSTNRGNRIGCEPYLQEREKGEAMSHDSRWSPQEEDTLRDCVKRYGLQGALRRVEKKLHRTEDAVRSKARRMGLKG